MRPTSSSLHLSSARDSSRTTWMTRRSRPSCWTAVRLSGHGVLFRTTRSPCRSRSRTRSERQRAGRAPCCVASTMATCSAARWRAPTSCCADTVSTRTASRTRRFTSARTGPASSRRSFPPKRPIGRRVSGPRATATSSSIRVRVVRDSMTSMRRTSSGTTRGVSSFRTPATTRSASARPSPAFCRMVRRRASCASRPARRTRTSSSSTSAVRRSA